MLKTIIILLVTLIVLPVVAVRFDQPLTLEQLEMLKTATCAFIAVALACFVVGEATSNTSQVDKLWSILPVGYTWYFAIAGGYQPRMILMAGLVTVWGIRLTYNFALKDAYSWKFWTGEEDYRWNVLRQNPLLKGKIRWTLFNLFFICLYQNALILMFTLPMLVAYQGGDKPIGAFDIILAIAMLGFITIESIADAQQRTFQTEKHRQIKQGETLQGNYAKGFIDTGLWAKVRHPNYASEQAIWIVFYLFSVAATGRWINWSMAGCLLLVILFQGSSDFSEKISAGKYPAYEDYKKRVGRFLPF